MKEKIRQALAARNRLVISDERLSDSAVLLPIFEKDGRCHILFTKRTSHLAHHQGQISFPGGGRHEGDKSPMETALRESREEIGLLERDVEVVGELDDAATATSNYRITPFVGFIPYPYEFKKDDFEVEEIFDVALEDLLKAHPKEEDMVFMERPVRVYTFEVDGRVIWGATAWILKQFLEILRTVTGARCSS